MDRMKRSDIATRSIYSFAGWIGTLVAYFCFIVWAFVPERFLHSLGITYYPSRYYAIALPSYILVLFVLVGVSYVGYNMMKTNSPDDIRTIRDSVKDQTRTAPLHFVKSSLKEGIPDFGDIDAIRISTLLKSKYPH